MEILQIAQTLVPLYQALFAQADDFQAKIQPYMSTLFWLSGLIIIKTFIASYKLLSIICKLVRKIGYCVYCVLKIIFIWLYENSFGLVNYYYKGVDMYNKIKDAVENDESLIAKKKCSAILDETKSQKKHFSAESQLILREWLSANATHPYPTNEEKDCLSKKAGITIEQLYRWFLHARHRNKAKDNDRLTVEQRLLLQKAYKERSAEWDMKQIRTISKTFNIQSEKIVSWLKRAKKLY